MHGRVATAAKTVPSADRTPLTFGVACLALYTMVAVGRVQEAIPPLALVHIGMVFGLLTLVAWLSLPGTLAHKIPVTLKPVKYVLVLLGLAVLTVPIGVWPGHSFEFVSGSYIKTVLLFLFIYSLCRSLTDVRWLIWGCGIGLTVLVVNGILSGNLGRPLDLDEAYEYASKTYDPNDLALVLVMMVPLYLYLFSTTRNVIAKLTLIGMMLIGMYGMVVTQSRGGFMALLAAGVLILRRSTLAYGQKLAVAFAAIVVFGFLAGPAFWERIRTIWDPQTELDQQYGGRSEIWKTGIMLMLTHPWGVGIDGFVYAEGLSHGGVGKWAAAHNTLIQVGTDLGVAGLIVFLLLMVYTFRLLKSLQQSGQAESRAAPLGRRLQRAVARPAVPLLGRRAAEDHTGNVVLFAASLEISLVAFVIGGFFLSQAYGTLLYVLIALTLVTARIAGRLELPMPRAVRGAAAAAPAAARYGRRPARPKDVAAELR